MKTKWTFLMILALLAMLVGGNVAPAQAQEPQTYSISGFVFNDYDGDATWDSDEPGLGGAFIQLDGSCNGAEYGTPYTHSADDGSYSFTGVPAGQSYCFLLQGPSSTWVETIVPQIPSLDGDRTAMNIGLTTSWLVLNPSPVPNAQLGEYYFQQFAISGGTGPITLGGTYTMPDGMAFNLDGRTLTLSGTPTESGFFGNGAKVADSAVPPYEYTSLNFQVYGIAEFNLTADPNPSAEGQMVSFTFSASDPNSTVQFPYGLVTFYADETPIEGCTNVYLNVVVVNGAPTYGAFPAVCQTAALAAGTHAIRADFTSYSLYHDASLTLACGQTVGTALHCISGAVFNDKDADGVYDPGTGGPEDEYGLSNVPVAVDVGCDGIFAPDEPATQTASDGTFGFSLPEHGRYCITAELETGWARTTPGVVEIADLTGPAIVNFGMQHLELHFSPQVFPDATLGVYYNETMTVTDGVGPYTFGGQTTDYWPAPGLTWEFNPTTGALTLSGMPTTLGNYGSDWAITDSRGVEGWPDLGVWVNMNLADTISGTFFNDANYNKLMDVDETGLAGKYVYVSHCDGTNTLQAGLTDEFGAYTTFPLLAGQCYTIFSTLNALPSGYAYTVFPPQIASLNGNMTGMNIGAAPMAFSPAGFPDGRVGTSYDATVAPLGGIGPFTITWIEPSPDGGPYLPAGLAYSFDGQTGAIHLYGTPTATQVNPFFIEAYIDDSLGSEFRFSSYYQILPGVSADLSLTKTDSKDPVKPGASLVYTLTVNNLGPDAAQTVTLVDTLDRNTKYVSVAAPKGWKCTYANYAVTCTGASLASGGSAVIKITVTVNKTAKAGKELVNNATVSCVTYDPVMLNNTVVQKTLVAK